MSDKTFTQEDVDRIVQERLARDRQTRVMAEPRKYDLHSPYSWYADIAARAEGGNNAPPAVKRLIEYERELGWHMAQGTKEGQRAERVLRTVDRVANVAEHERRHAKRVRELRAFGTDGGVSVTSPGEAATFVSPAFLLDSWAPFHGGHRTFADLCGKLPLPSYGMHIYLPFFSTTDKVNEQTEGSEVTETAPEAGLEGASVVTISGKINVSGQLRDRSMTGGGTLDAVLSQQLKQQIDEKVDLYALNQAISSGKAIAGNGTYSTEHLYEDVAKGREEVADTAGTRLRPTVMLTTTDLYSYATRQFDKNERPIVLPDFVPGFPIATGADDASSPAWSRFMGNVMPGGLLWFTDDNIPTVGTASRTQILVSSPAESMVLMEDEPVVTPFIETLANTLRVVFVYRQYTAAITRHASGTAVITGGAYVSTQK